MDSKAKKKRLCVCAVCVACAVCAFLTPRWYCSACSKTLPCVFYIRALWLPSPKMCIRAPPIHLFSFRVHLPAKVIFSCVRAAGRVGFLADSRRMNVALTRAKEKMIVIGHVATLSKDPAWNRLVGPQQILLCPGDVVC